MSDQAIKHAALQHSMKTNCGICNYLRGPKEKKEGPAWKETKENRYNHWCLIHCI